MRDSAENLVIGGGPAGSMLAHRLACAGRQVVLLEKEREAHDKVCGEFLSREAVEYLKQIGVDPHGLGSRSIQHVRLYAGGRAVGSPLPFTAVSLSRRVMDEALLAKAEMAGCEVQRGSFVEELRASERGWTARIRGGRSIEAKTVFLATGKHDLNGWLRGNGVQCDLVGFKMHWKLANAQVAALCGVMELFLFRGGYGGLSLVGGETANLCFVVRRQRLRESGGWRDLLEAIRDEVSAIDERLRDAIPCWMKPLAISPIPYGHISRAADGIWRVGDQAAVIPSFTGDGMSIALHSAVLAAEMYLCGRSADQYAKSLKQQLQSGMQFASLLSRIMVTSGGRALAPALMSFVPKTVSWIASSTRIPERALLHEAFEPVPDAGQPPAQIA